MAYNYSVPLVVNELEREVGSIMFELDVFKNLLLKFDGGFEESLDEPSALAGYGKDTVLNSLRLVSSDLSEQRLRLASYMRRLSELLSDDEIKESAPKSMSGSAKTVVVPYKIVDSKPKPKR